MASYKGTLQDMNGNNLYPVNPWQIVDTKTGTASISIPSWATDIKVLLQYGSNNLYFTFSLIMVELSSSEKTYSQGYYSSASANSLIQIGASNTAVRIVSFYINGVNYASTAKITVYAK